MAADTPKTRRAVALPARSPKDPSPLDERYAALVEELENNLTRAMDGLTEPLSAEQRTKLATNWQNTARPALVKQLTALVGPILPVLAEACIAFNRIGSHAGGRPSDYRTCKGATVAVVTRLGRPESPGRIITHYPGCTKHANMALANLGATITSASGHYNFARVFHSVIALDDARRELRQQELADEAAKGDRAWWRFGR